MEQKFFRALVQTMVSHLPFRIYFQPLAHPSRSPSFHSSRGKVGILGSPFSNFFSSLLLSLPFRSSPFSLSLSSPFSPWESPSPVHRRRDSSGARVSSRWQNEIDRKDHDDIDDEGGGSEDRCRKYLCAGRNGFIGGGWSKRAIEYSTEGLRSREFTTTRFYSPR